jgi:hypothetical protein
MVEVSWQEWQDRSGVGRFGVYHAYERLFHLRNKAEGFADGLKLNPHIREVEIKVVAQRILTKENVNV